VLANLRIAARALARRPGWTATVVATLALGLGGAFAVGNVAYGILLRPLPYPEPDRLVRIYETNRGGGRMNVADPNYADLAALDGLFAGAAQYAASLVAVDAGGGPQRRMGATVSGELFDLLGVQPVHGRLFSADERRAGGAAVALVSETLWREWRPASGELADLRLEIDGTPFAVVGVLPVELDFPFGAQLWAPRELDEPLPSRTAHNFPALARLRDGVSLTAARDGVAALARRLIAEHGDDVDLTGIALVPLLETQVASARPALLLVLGAAAFLLVVAVVNVASLLVARFRSQQAEIATRVALGAGDRRLAAHFLGEWLLLAVPGMLGGLALAATAAGLLRRHAPQALPRLDAVRFDAAAAGGAALLVAAVSLALVLAALRRARRLDVDAALRAGSVRAGGGRRGWLRALPLGVQAAATFLLLAALALVGTSLDRLLRVDPGFRTSGVDVVDLYPPSARVAGIARRAGEYDELVARLTRLPAVREAGLVSRLPLGGAANGTFLELGESEPPADYEEFGALMRSGLRTGDALYVVASEGYFRALDIGLVEGRLFEPRDDLEAPHVALVSAALARATWPGESALGRRLEFGNMDGDLRPLTVVGVVADVRHSGLEEPAPAIVYTNYRQRPQGAWAMSAVLAGDGGGLAAAAVRSAVEPSLPGAPWRLRRIDDVLAASLAERRLLLALLATFGGIALALAAAGIFGAVAVAVAERRREYALRLALGARENGIRALALRHGLVPTLAGVAGGAVAALAAGRLLAGLLFEIRPHHPPALAAAVLAISGVAVAAAWIPARRAGAVEPAALLRAE
jgi:putative ABC transport system permease protein